MHAAPRAEYPNVTGEMLKQFDGFLFGIPTRYGQSARALREKDGNLSLTAVDPYRPRRRCRFGLLREDISPIRLPPGVLLTLIPAIDRTRLAVSGLPVLSVSDCLFESRQGVTLTDRDRLCSRQVRRCLQFNCLAARWPGDDRSHHHPLLRPPRHLVRPVPVHRPGTHRQRAYPAHVALNSHQPIDSR